MTEEDTLYDYYSYYYFDRSNASSDSSTYRRYWNETRILDGIISPISVVIALVSNIFIVIIFSRRDLRSSTTCLLVSIAVSDTLKGVCLYAFKPYFYLLPTPYVDFPICVWDYYSVKISNFFLNCSVTLTTILGLQKFCVVQFPFHVKGVCTIKLSLVLICLSMVIGLVTWIVIPLTEEVTLSSLSELNITKDFSNVSQNACFLVVPDAILGHLLHDHIVMVESVTFLICFIIMIFVTVALTVHLMRTKKIEDVRIMSEQEKWKRRRSIILIIAILVVFVVSEMLLLVSHWCYLVVDILGYTVDFCDITFEHIYLELQDFSFQIGAACNLWIYVIISSKFRDAFKRFFTCKTK